MSADLLEVALEYRAGAFALSAAFTAPRGPVALLGPSGAGKTLTLKCLAGIIQPDSGRIVLNGRTLFDSVAGVNVTPQSRRVGYVPQQYALFPHLSVAGNVGFGLGAEPAAERRDRVAEMLDLVGLADMRDARPRQLSGGQRQRVAVARALATRPEILILDEPFAALDPLLRSELSDALATVTRATATAVLMVTHDRAEALRLGDQIVVMMGGRVRQSGPPAGVFGAPADEEVGRFVGVETIVPGRVRALDDGVPLVDVAGHSVEGGSEPVAPGDDVLVCLRPEDVVVAPVRDASPTSARNHLPATVTRIVAAGPFLRVELDAGFPLVALITKQSREELALDAGAAVVATFKASAVHLIPRRA